MKKALGGVAIAAVSGVLFYGIIPTLAFKKKQNPNIPQGKICLTFDDGPDAQYTERLLDLLSKYEIKAGFFVVAKFAEQNPKIIARMKDEGHGIGLHSLCHKNGLLQTPGSTKKDFESAIKIMENLGVELDFFRPPWGHVNLCMEAEAKKRGLRPMLWNVMAEDWKADTNAEEIAAKLLKRTKDGGVVCLHDGRGRENAPERMLGALAEVLPIWKFGGYDFIGLEEAYE